MPEKSQIRNYPHHVLLVEDRNQPLTLITELFNSSNCYISSATHGREAIDQAKRHPIDLIYMDLSLARMDELEVTRQVLVMYETAEMIPTIGQVKSNSHYLTTRKHHNLYGFIPTPVQIPVLVELINGIDSTLASALSQVQINSPPS